MRAQKFAPSEEHYARALAAAAPHVQLKSAAAATKARNVAVSLAAWTKTDYPMLSERLVVALLNVSARAEDVLSLAELVIRRHGSAAPYADAIIAVLTRLGSGIMRPRAFGPPKERAAAAVEFAATVDRVVDRLLNPAALIQNRKIKKPTDVPVAMPLAVSSAHLADLFRVMTQLQPLELAPLQLLETLSV